MLIAPENESTSPGAPPKDDLHKSTTSNMDISLSSVLLQKSIDHPTLDLILSFSATC